MSRGRSWVPGLVLGALLLAVPGAGRASDARIEGLGIDAFYIDDFEAFRTFPTVIARTNNIVVASLGTAGADQKDNYFGVIASGARSKYGTFSVFLRGRSPFLDALGTFDPLIGPNIRVPSQQYDLGWARQFARVTLGARFEQARSRYEVGEGEALPAQNPGSNNWNTTAFHAGVKWDTRRFDFLEVGGELRVLSFKDTFRNPALEDDAGLSYRLSARYWTALSDKVDLVPAFNYTRVDVTRKGDQEDRIYSSLHAGGAFLFDVNQDNLLTLGAAFTRQENGAADVSITWLPTLFGSLEWDIKSWLTGRVGARQAMRLTSQDDDRSTTESDFRYGLGVGLHFNNFDLDATLNEQFPFTGGYFLSGRETSGDLFGRITGIYYF